MRSCRPLLVIIALGLSIDCDFHDMVEEASYPALGDMRAPRLLRDENLKNADASYPFDVFRFERIRRRGDGAVRTEAYFAIDRNTSDVYYWQDGYG